MLFSLREVTRLHMEQNLLPVYYEDNEFAKVY